MTDHLAWEELDAAGRAEWREREAAVVRRKARLAAGVPQRVEALFGSLRETEPVVAARRFMVDGARSMLFLAGGPGCGKTVAACVALDLATKLEAQEYLPVVKAVRVGRFVKAMDLIRLDTFDGDAWDGLVDLPLLVVDDLGAEPLDGQGWGLSKIASLLDARYDAQARTVVTTNLPLEQFRQRYADGGRLIDRIREAGSFTQFAGRSLRRAPSEPKP